MSKVFFNSMKKKLKAGEVQFGAFVTTPCPEVVEVIGATDFDFVILDTEHTASGIETVVNMIRAAEIYGMTSVVRVPDDIPKNISRYQDVGAYGIQVPMIHNADQADKIVKAMKFMPDGMRGMSGGRGTKWGRIPDYISVSNEETFISIMCESLEGLNNINEIVDVPGLDGVFIGTFDLSQALGVPGQISHPMVEEAVLKILSACKRKNVIPGIVAPTIEIAKKRLEQGFLYITILDDMAFFADAIMQRLQSIKNFK